MFRNLPQYEIIKTERIEDVKSDVTLLRHIKSGARVLLLENHDENKVFDIAFRTPPADSTGVAHILEHSVLCGSKKFPSKDPFVELAKGSLNTFLNAMTYPDKTMYPVASCNFQDLCNLMQVYVDAVFFPNIYNKEEIFRQEGWSYILEKPEDDLIYNGVVYNEMKGAFSSADDVLEREIMNSLFPDTAYGVESGGDPKAIPKLTYENFLDFHRRYYHPSNSYIYLYGDMDMEERLAWLDEEYLRKYDAILVDSQLKMQKPFAEMKVIEKTYPIANNEEEEDNTYLAWNVAVGDASNARLSNAMAVLEYVLLSAPGAPLKQALLDAGIGQDVEGSYDGGILQPTFSVIAKYANPQDQDRFMEIIRTTLQELVQKGVGEKAILAAVNNMEFKFREADYGHYPRGLMYGIDAFDSWLYDDNDPAAYLKQLQVCAFLKEQAKTGYYEEIIQKELLDNTHASLIIMKPEKGLIAKEEARVKEELANYKASLSEKQIAELIEKTKKLRVFQETPSTKEELEAIPLLQLSDIKKEIEPLYNEERTVEDISLIYHEIDTNGIAYLSLMFDASDVPAEKAGYLGILKAVLGMVDTQKHSYPELSQEIDIHSGGIYPALDAFTDAHKPDHLSSKFGMAAKVLYSEMDFAFDTMEEILFSSKLEDKKRLREILARLKSQLQMRLTSAGHLTSATRAMAAFSLAAAFGDRTGGIAFYQLVEELEEHFEDRSDDLIKILKELMAHLFTKRDLMVSLTAEREALSKVEERLESLKTKLAEGTHGQAADLLEKESHNEGFETSAQVQYVALAGNYRSSGLEYTGALRVLKTIMGYEYLWTNIRVQGGAYGCMSGYGRTGDTYFVSYRDPNLGRTLKAYEGIPAYLREFSVDDRDMRKYIIGTMSELDTPKNARAKGSFSMQAYLCKITQEDLQRERTEVLSCDQEAIRGLAPMVEAVLKEGNICVLGNENRIEEEKELFDERKPLIGQNK